MKTDFLELVAEMRKAQKEYFALVTSKDAAVRRHDITRVLQRCKKLEADVDRAIIAEKDQARQMAFSLFSKRTDEQPGAYNVTNEAEEAKDGGA